MTTASRSDLLIEFGPFALETDSGKLRKNARLIRLQPLSLQLLLILLREPGKVVTRGELQRALWPDGTFVDFDEGLNHAVQRLRDTLGDSADRPVYIETIPRRGYKFLVQPKVTPMLRQQQEYEERPPFVADHPAPLLEKVIARPLFRPRELRVIFAILLSVILGFAIAYKVVRKVPLSREPVGTSIAVLPLKALSEGNDQKLLAYGMTDELITMLTRIGGLSKVTSHTSTGRYIETNKSLPEIARELNVALVIEGTVLREGNRAHVNIQLIDAATDKHLWAQSYDLSASDIVSVQSRLARDVASQVRVEITAEDAARMEQDHTSDPIAFECYIKGRYYAAQGDYPKSAAYLQQAVDRDPNFALAYAQLAESLGMIRFSQERPFSMEESAAARAAAARAVALAPNLAETNIHMADATFYRLWDWKTGEAAFRHAVELNPNSVDAVYHYALALYVNGRYEDALAQAQRALELDPWNPIINRAAANLAKRLGRPQQAVEFCKKSIDSRPNAAVGYLALAAIYADMQRLDDAKEQYRLGIDLMSDLSDAQKRELNRIAEKRDSAGFQKKLAEFNLARLNQQAKSGYVSPLSFARVYTAIGDKDRAFVWLDRAYQQRIPALAWIKASDDWKSLHADSRYKQLLRKMGLE